MARPAWAQAGARGSSLKSALPLPSGPVKTPVSPTLEQWPIVDEQGEPLSPLAVLAAGDDLFFLSPRGLWCVPAGRNLLSEPQKLMARCLGPSAMSVRSIPVQEFNNFAYCSGRKSLVVLDKSGDLFEFWIGSGKWDLFRTNRPTTGSPDPDFMDLASMSTRICLLDPERNQIWRFPSSAAQPARYFKEVLPWRLKPGDPNVADGIGIAFDGDTYVLKRSGAITKYGGSDSAGLAIRKPFPWKRCKGMRPSRIVTEPGLPLYIVERENNRVLVIDKRAGRAVSFLFPGEANLRGLLPDASGFFVLDGCRLTRRSLDRSSPVRANPSPRRIDPRLDGLVLPIAGIRLPRHPGVWPGSRRLYRYGIHQGVDFFDDRACSTRVIMGTKVRAADAGRVIRADLNFLDMDGATFRRVMRQCLAAHCTSDSNEDLFRGCQIWIDHGNGLVTRYAHLGGIRNGIRSGCYVSQGETIGYVGVSGTGENLPGNPKHPHLHFEIWLDGNYLGWGLTPAETVGVFEDIFGTACEVVHDKQHDD